MAIGVMFGRRSISGSCGGLANVKNEDGSVSCSRIRDSGELPLANTVVTLRNLDGSPLARGEVAAESFADGPISNDSDGVAITADGLLHGVEVGSFESALASGARVFHAMDQQRNKWLERWSSKVAFQADFDQPLGEVQIDAIGIGTSSFARIEAYDDSGQLIARSTSDELINGQRVTVRVTDTLGRITSIRAFGHAGSSVALGGLQFGSSGRAITDAGGSWQIPNLPDGSYLVDFQAEGVIYQYQSPSQAVDVVAGSSSLVLAAVDEVDNRHNAQLGGDVNGDGQVSAADALVVINDLFRFGPRDLSSSDPTTFFVDVSNDGAVSSLDALLVINRLARDDGASGEAAPAHHTPSVRGEVAALSGEVLWEPIDPIPRQMLDSAGSRSGGESIDVESADSTVEHQLGKLRTGRFPNFVQSEPPIRPETAPKEETQPSGANETDLAIDLNHPELSEPFASKAI